MLKKFIEYTKGYRFLTLLCPVMIYLDVVVELKIPEVMGQVTDILVSIKAGSIDPALITGQLRDKLFEMLLLRGVTLQLPVWDSVRIYAVNFSIKFRTFPLKI